MGANNTTPEALIKSCKDHDEMSSFSKVFFPSFQMRPSGTHLYQRVCQSVGPSVVLLVGRLCKNRVSWLFLATVRSYAVANDQPTCFESLMYYSVVSSVCSSICLSTYIT